MKHGTMEEMATCRPCCMHLSFGYVLLLDSARASAVCAFYMRKGQHKKVLGWRSLTHYSLDMSCNVMTRTELTMGGEQPV
ncbi:hypothetical protein SEVIR_3G427350v4 [Setaria viridis]